MVQDPSGGDPGVYLVPPDVLLEGPNGEYVFAADAMAGGNLAGDLGRVVHAPIDAVYTVPASDVVRWAGGDELQVELEQPVSVDLDGHTLVVEDGGSVAAADVPAVFALGGGDRTTVTALQTALVAAALDAAALRPEGERRRLAGASPSPQAGPALSEVLARITAGSAVVELFPASTRVAEGQFAFVPDPEAIQAGITRRSPAYHAAVTVQVLNGSGKVGVGEAVVERLASLDVNLPRPLNADTFSYSQTQILAGADTLPVARDIRAILGRGVVLDGPELPDGTVQVIVGDDFQASQSGHKGPAVAARPEPTTSERLARDISRPPQTRRRRTSSSSAWTRPCRTPTTSSSSAAPTRGRRRPSPTRSSKAPCRPPPRSCGGGARGRVGPRRLHRRRRARVHDDGSRLLPSRDAVGRRPAARRARGGLSAQTTKRAR